MPETPSDEEGKNCRLNIPSVAEAKEILDKGKKFIDSWKDRGN